MSQDLLERLYRAKLQYQQLLNDVRDLRDDLRSLSLQASDYEAPAYQDAWYMAAEVIHNAQEREQDNGES